MAVRPCLRALREARVLPSSVTGPRERAPLRREASIWAGERAAGMAVVRWVVGGQAKDDSRVRIVCLFSLLEG